MMGGVKLPVMPPIKPMLAKPVKEMPSGDVLYEPKWDGFRCIVFRDGDEVELGSRNERPLTRYFPDIVDAIKDATNERCVVDGEIVIARDGRLDFEALQMRLHPAESRVRMLAQQTPAEFVAFDLLAHNNDDLTTTAFRDRRARLETAITPTKNVHLTPATEDIETAKRWFKDFEGAGLDGIIVKPMHLPYKQDERVMFKVKHERTADCVLAGFRWHKSGPIVGSLLLGLYDDETRALRHVGVAASFSTTRRKELVDELAPLRDNAHTNHPWYVEGGWGPGGTASRWNADKDLSFEPLRPELVVEVAYDYMEGARFRHTAQFRRWRPDRDPKTCTFAQLDRPVTYAIEDVLATGQ